MADDPQWTKQQPKDGETVLCCGHRDAEPYHWYEHDPPTSFSRPDLSVGLSRWTVLCETCNTACGGDTDKAEIREDFIWNGDDPFIERENLQ